jgi:proteasome lid subunit RPN8/RPN11
VNGATVAAASEEWPTVYIRGKNGLRAQVDRVTAVTGGQLEYVGEWHSHPDGCSCLPSDDDAKVFAWLTEHLADAGRPALMAIVGQNHASALVPPRNAEKRRLGGQSLSNVHEGR